MLVSDPFLSPFLPGLAGVWRNQVTWGGARGGKDGADHQGPHGGRDQGGDRVHGCHPLSPGEREEGPHRDQEIRQNGHPCHSSVCVHPTALLTPTITSTPILWISPATLCWYLNDSWLNSQIRVYGYRIKDGEVLECTG